MSALGQKQTYVVQKGMSALPPIATAKADFRNMSALPPKADMCGAIRDVRFGPIADIGASDAKIDRLRHCRCTDAPGHLHLHFCWPSRVAILLEGGKELG